MPLRRASTAIAAAILAAACQDLPADPEPGPRHASSGAAGIDRAELYLSPLEQQFADIEEAVPGFAGWYFDRQGNAVVRVKDAVRQAEAIERVGRILDARGQAGRGAAQARKGRRAVYARPAAYSFTELVGFRKAVRAGLPEGVYSLDLDEVNNVISVGVRDGEAAGRLNAVAARLGLPGAALRVWIAPEPQSRATLSDYQRPIRGGVMHSYVLANIPRHCAVGINATWGGTDTYAGYITASHCTQVAFGSDWGIHYQPDVPYRIGTEQYDPAPQTGATCPAFYTCRRSDAAFVIYDYGVRAAANGYNTIAQTVNWNRGAPSSTEVDGYMTIAGTYYSAPWGDEIEKVGPTSGWTWGYVTGTCVDKASDRRVNGVRVWIFCNLITDIYSDGGDSGSPVFKWYGDTVDWVGILWGGPLTDLNETWVSPAYNVEYDLPGYSFWF